MDEHRKACFILEMRVWIGILALCENHLVTSAKMACTLRGKSHSIWSKADQVYFLPHIDKCAMNNTKKATQLTTREELFGRGFSSYKPRILSIPNAGIFLLSGCEASTKRLEPELRQMQRKTPATAVYP